MNTPNVDGEPVVPPDEPMQAVHEPVIESRSPRTAVWNSLVNWFLVRGELARAREEEKAAQFSEEGLEFLRRAKLAFEAGELMLAPGSVVRSGSTAPLASNCFRESLYWALLSRQPAQAAEVRPELVWASAAPASVAGLTKTDAELAEVAQAMSSTFIQFAEGTPKMQRARAELLRSAASRLLDRAQRFIWQLEWAKSKRLARMSLAVGLLALMVVLTLGLWSAKTDLAKGKPWHTSSVGLVCHPEVSDCGGVTTDILFHTKLEKDPWFEYDFGSPLAFSSLTVRNRTDFGGERAIPLVAEVSNDDKHFHEIARRVDAFTTWKPSFPTQHARYLRLRVDRESMLHLEAVKVHR